VDFRLSGAGSYKAVLLEFQNEQSVAIAQSEVFQVRTSCISTSATFTVSTNKQTYEHGEDVQVSFSFGNNGETLRDDWIGLYPASASANDLRDSDMWLYVCNSQFSCNTPVRTIFPSFHFVTFLVACISSLFWMFAFPGSRWHSDVWSGRC
jgi:hypothetical protein